ncbi:MAG: NAD(P)-dependent oxidoreductase [Paracoccaceae bacterium]|nr:MAG: NAD(P)-dependent oxidoreductase [Paracoccaceae bacterium]
MAANLARAEFVVSGFDIDPSRGAALVAAGGASLPSVAAVAADADVVITLLMTDEILDRVALGSDGVLAHLAPGAILADLSTVSPEVSRRVGQAASGAGRGYVCGKVAGSVALAESAGLTLFASGNAADFARCRPAFAAMARAVHHVGAGDEAAYLKLVHSLIVGVYSAMIGEALAFGQRGGLSVDMMLDILEPGPLGSRQMTLKAPVLKARDFDRPPSDIDTAAKDMDLILNTARRDRMPLPMAATVRQMMASAQATGSGKRDIYAILETFERLAGLEGAA